LKSYLHVAEDDRDPEKLHVVSPVPGEDFVDRLIRLMNGGGMVALALAQHAERAGTDRPAVRDAIRSVAVRAMELRAAIVVLDAVLVATPLPTSLGGRAVPS
jgi:hypothetical protein